MSSAAEDFPTTLLAAAINVYRKQKTLGERAIAQLDDAQLFEMIDPEANSVATIVKHLHGNMRSRWTDFLTTDGEKPDRQRDTEFVLTDEERSRSAVLDWWNAGWGYVFSGLESLAPADLERTVTVRGEKMSAGAAILRQIDHYGQHVGQIVLLAKHLRGANWQTLSIPRGKSAEFDAHFRKHNS
ncbi:MAG TPA: DUF1572 family protein [Gemmatimonadaceae bacterium]|nr:DUF1572 family protein [Gemmatimonadaceae bacterium]